MEKTEIIIPIAIAVYIIPIILNIMTLKTAKRLDSSSMEEFDVRPSPAFAGAGAVIGGVALYFMISRLSAGQHQKEAALICGCMLALGIILMLVSTKGFWDVIVRGDVVTATRLWFSKKYIKISDIDHCSLGYSGLHVYLKGQKKKTFTISNISSNIYKFVERMRRAGKNVRLPSK